jgi:hypothetical protein
MISGFIGFGLGWQVRKKAKIKHKKRDCPFLDSLLVILVFSQELKEVDVNE